MVRKAPDPSIARVYKKTLQKLDMISELIAHKFPNVTMSRPEIIDWVCDYVIDDQPRNAVKKKKPKKRKRKSKSG